MSKALTFLMAYDSNFKVVGDACYEQLRRYCDRHDYGLRVMNPAPPKSGQLHPSWNKIVLLRDEIESSKSDWVIWIDADTVITNPEVSFHEVLQPVTTPSWFSCVDQQMCAGVFGLKPGKWSEKFLDTVWRCGQMDDNLAGNLYRSRWEQATIKMLATHFPWVRDNYCLVDENIVQNPWSPFNAAAFMCHFWMGPTRTQEKAAEWIRRAGKMYDLALFNEIILPRK